MFDLLHTGDKKTYDDDDRIIDSIFSRIDQSMSQKFFYGGYEAARNILKIVRAILYGETPSRAEQYNNTIFFYTQVWLWTHDEVSPEFQKLIYIHDAIKNRFTQYPTGIVDRAFDECLGYIIKNEPEIKKKFLGAPFPESESKQNYNMRLKQQQKVKQAKSRWKWIIVILLIISFAVYYVGLPYYKLREADKLYLEGKSNEAAEIFLQYMNNVVWKTKAIERYNSAINDVATMAMVNHDYDRAIEIYKKIGDDDKEKGAWFEYAEYFFENGDYQKAATIFDNIKNSIKANEAWDKYGDILLESKEYEQAISAYTNEKNEDKIQSVHFYWAENLTENEQYDEAAEHYILAGREEKAREIMISKAKQMIADGDTDGILDVLKPYKGTDIVNLLFEAQKTRFENGKSEEAVNNARKYGEAITDLDMQLYYCQKLYEENYDLKKVYPEGVLIEMDLAQYQIYNSDDESKTPDYSRVIVFSRRDKVPNLEIKSETLSTKVESAVEDQWRDRRDGHYDYTVKLRPDLMIDLLDNNQAWSENECTGYIILDEGYLPIGSISIRTITTSQYGTFASLDVNTSYKILLYYAAYSAITVYDKNNPKQLVNYDTYLDYPVAANAVVGNSYSDFGIDLSALQIEEIQKALNDRNSEESQQILSKYDSKVIEFVEQNGWGDYILIPDRDDKGNQKNYKGTSSNIYSWNVPKYMLGQPNEAWINEKLDDAIANLSLYFLFNGQGIDE